MLMDNRNMVLDCTKDCNNLYNCRKRTFPKGKKEAGIKPFIKALYPTHDDFLMDSDERNIHRWEKSNSKSKIYYKISANIRDLVNVLQCQPYELYFENIDDCVEYENKFLIECFNKFEDELKNFVEDKNMVSNEDIVRFQKKITASPDYFYYQVMESAINVCELFDTQIVQLETELRYKSLEKEVVEDKLNLKEYIFKFLNIVKNFLNNTFFKLYNVLGKYKFTDIYLFNEELSKVELVKKKNRKISQVKVMLKEVGIPQQEWDDILVYLSCDDGSSIELNENTDKSDYNIRYQKHIEHSGNYFYKLLGRFYEYTKLLNYLPDNLDKSLEIIAANNWNELFKSLITQIKIHALEYDSEMMRGDTNSFHQGLFYSNCKYILNFYNNSNIDQNVNKLNMVGINENIDNLDAARVSSGGSMNFMEKQFEETLNQLLIEYSQLNNSRLYNNHAYGLLRDIDIDFNKFKN